MGHQHQLFNDPFASRISSLEPGMVPGVDGQKQWPDFGLDVEDILAAPAANNATSSGGYGSAGGGSGSHRKVSHNAYERDRRKHLNGLYSSLRTLLPDDDHSRKLSIPITVTKVLKYIPELQKEVGTLEKKKEELSRAKCKPGVATTRENAALIVLATCLDDRDIRIQVSLLSNMAGALPMSKCIEVLENEGVRLVSSSTSQFQNRTFYSLYLQRTQRTMNKECPAFSEELESAIKKKAGMRLQQ
uniref:Uncharacterized protein n=1 Tax=Avena sativa TaxID=4498 RepID=A0ACD5XI38_AVESA